MINKFVFGPVPSRRLGRSLGINIIPSKICSLDCIYCEAGKTTELTCKIADYFNPDEIFAEFVREYEKVKDVTDVVTITGAGEPTLNSHLAEIARKIKSVSKHPLAILTNSTTLADPNVVEALKLFDIVVPSLDAATQRAFRRVNLPAAELDIEEINKALIRFTHIFSGKIFLEVLLVKSINDSQDELQKIAEVIKQCRYTMVQVNTVFRPPAYEGVKGLSPSELIDAFLFFKSLDINVEPVGNFVKTLAAGNSENLAEQIIALVNMRPCSSSEIASVFGASSDNVDRAIQSLISAGKIEKQLFNGGVFFFGKK